MKPSALFPGTAPLSLPLIGAPMFLASGPELVVAQCKAGVIGTMPSLNVRAADQLEPVLEGISSVLAEHDRVYPERRAAPFGVNLIAHRTNLRFEHDLAVCVRRKVPLVITSLGPSRRVVDQVHSYGGAVFHDVINLRHARKAIDEGVDGIVAVSAGAGGHAGLLHPFALVGEIRRLFRGWIALSGAISTGGQVAAALAAGADFAYIGTRFIATLESSAPQGHKDMVLTSDASGIVYTPFFSGVHANYLRASIEASGLDPDALTLDDSRPAGYTSVSAKPRAWKDVWSAGQGVGLVNDLLPTSELVSRMLSEYREALGRTTAALSPR